MSLIVILYLLFVALSLPLFARIEAGRAASIVYLAGLIYLPPTDYPPVPVSVFAYWITGAAVPSDLLLSKAWIAPVVALAGASLFSSRNWLHYRPVWSDAAMAGWCLWPLVQGLLVDAPSPPGWLSALYLAGVWGAPWLLGRLYLGDVANMRFFLKALVYASLPLIPFALWEALAGPGLYDLLIQHHPFLRDGAERYVGSRPLLFFENGNQYGIWICCVALAAIGLARDQAGYSEKERWIVIAAIVTVLAIIAQSIGALALLALAVVYLLLRSIRRGARALALPLLLGALVLGGAYGSGLIPLRSWVQHSAAGGKLLDVVRATGRGSLTWRVSQDQKAVSLIMKAPVIGSGHWDWWRPAKTRPWGLIMLIAGQFGLIGLALLGCALGGPLFSMFLGQKRAKGTRQTYRLVMLISLMGIADALLNAFIFLPAIALVAMLAGGGQGVSAGRKRSRRDQFSAGETREKRISPEG